MNPFQHAKKWTLPNGLTIITDENHSSPVVSLNLGVKIGSVWESHSQETEAGLSHVLEHMVFKGTKSYQPGEIAILVEKAGGELNAYTSLDQTVYYINLAAPHRELGLKLLSEMVFEATIDPTELEREKEVIVEEIRRGKDSPSRLISEELFGQIFSDHPYGKPVIGTEASVRSFSAQWVKQFYKKWYVPSNMVLIVSGDFNPADLAIEIDNLFGHYPPSPVVHPIIRDQFSQKNFTHHHIKKEVEAGHFILGLPIPNLLHEDIPTIDLMSHLLGGGDTSRLNTKLKEEKRLVSSIYSFAYTPRFQGIFGVQALMNGLDKNQINVVLSLLMEELESLKEHPVLTVDLERAKLNFKSSLYYDKETCEGTARKWMVFETTCGNYRFEETYLKRLEAVTPADILRVARLYLNREHYKLITLSKNKIPTLKKLPFLKKQKEGLKKASSPLFEQTASHGNITRYRLSNGLTVILRENHRLPLVSLSYSTWGGVRLEKKEENGISQLMTALLTKGTHKLNTLQIAKAIEGVAGSLNAQSGRNSWGLSLQLLSEKLETGLDLFADVLMNPLFDEKEFKKEKKWLLDAIHQQEDSPAQTAFKTFHQMLYPTHPYGLPVLGTKKSVSKITLQQIKKFHRERLSATQGVISIVGDFNSEILLESLTNRFGHLRDFNKQKISRLKMDPPTKKIQEKIIKKEGREQAHLVLGFLGTGIQSPDRQALELLSTLLSGQGGRLFLELRDKQSLAYTVTSNIVEGIERGYLAIYIGCEPQKTDRATAGILLELKKLQQEKISTEELERSKNYLIGNHVMDLQRLSSVASTLTYNELFGFPLSEYDDYIEKIRAVTTDDILRVANEYINLNAYTLALVTPPKQH